VQGVLFFIAVSFVPLLKLFYSQYRLRSSNLQRGSLDW
jgi:hypothetical protein